MAASLWQTLLAFLASSSNWAAIAAAALATLCVLVAIALACGAVLLAWGLFMYVRRWLGWRALWRQHS